MEPGKAKTSESRSIFAKAIANGFPLSAVVRVREVRDVTTLGKGRATFAGTYNGSQPSLAASKATLETIRDRRVQERLHRASSLLARKFNKFAEGEKVGAQLIGIGGQFRPYFTDAEVSGDYYRTAASSDQESYATFAKSLLDSGLMVHQSYLFHHGVSDAHDKKEYDGILLAFEKALRDVAAQSGRVSE